MDQHLLLLSCGASGTMVRWLLALGIVIAGALAPVLAGSSPSRPNVLLIVSDDQGSGDFAAAGNRYLATPHLDRLRAEGVSFTRFYTAPLCAPTRAALLTGRHQFRTGVWDTWKSRANLAADETTLAEAARRAGYRTGHFGKWHLGDNAPFRPQDQGFDESLVWTNSDRFAPVFARNGKSQPARDRFLDDAITDDAIAFMRASDGRPIFAYVPFFLPHTHFERQIGADFVRRFERFAELPPADRELYAMVEKLDENVGRLLAALREMGRERDTLVIFLSDNGPQPLPRAGGEPQRFNSGLRGGKGGVYEGGIRTPCFARWPGVLAPREIAAPVAVVDLFPTLAAAVDWAPGPLALDGENLWPLLTGAAQTLPDRIIFQQQQPQRSGQTPQPRTNAAAIGPRFKLVFPAAGRPPQLYDLVADPGETRDVASAEPKPAAALAAAYDEWFREVGASRGFEPIPSVIDGVASDSVWIALSNFSDAHGFPLRLAHAGRYRVEIHEVQADLFPRGGALGLTDRARVWKAAVKPGADPLVLEAELPRGIVNLFPWHEGKTPRLFPYGNEDDGFRHIVIRGPLPP